MALEKFRDSLRVLHVSLHAQGQGFQPFQELPRRDGLLAGTKVSQDPRAGFGDKSQRPKIIGIYNVVIGRVWFCKVPKSAALAPVEFTPVDDDTSDRCPMSTDEFGRRMSN